MLRRFVVAAIVRSEASYPGVPRAGGVVTGAFAAAPWCIVRTNLSSTQSGALTPLRCGLERHFVRASLREPRQLGQFLAAAAQGAGSTDRAKVSCTGPRTWPQLTPVVITAPNILTS